MIINTMKKSFFLNLMLFAVAVVPGKAQSTNPNPNPSLTNVVPPPPGAASLGKFGDIPVGYAT